MEKIINMNFRTTEDERKLYKKLAHKVEMSISDLIRHLLEEECKKQNLSIEDLKAK